MSPKKKKKKGTHNNHRSRHQARLAQKSHSMLIKQRGKTKKIAYLEN